MQVAMLGALEVDADLLTGVIEPLVAEFEELVVAHPLREPLAARLMRVLHACGRRGAALAVYEQVRERLADQVLAACPHVRILATAASRSPSPGRRCGP